MRSLIGPCGFMLIACFYTSTYASTLETSLRYWHYKKEVGSITNRWFQQISSKTERISYRIDKDHFSLTNHLEFSQSNLDQYIIRNATGQERSLQEILGKDAADVFARVQGVYYLERGQLSGELFAHLDSSPFRRYGGSLGYRWDYAQWQFFLQGSYYWQQMPEDYFIDNNFQNRRRATLLHVYSLRGAMERPINEWLRLGGEFFLEQKRGARPRHIGGRLRSAWAVRTNLFWRVRLSYMEELRSDALVDERGYFNFLSLTNSIVWEPLFEIFISVGYIFTRERESDPRIGSKLQTASDSYFLLFKHPLTWGTIEVSGDYTLSNREERLYTGEITVKWDY